MSPTCHAVLSVVACVVAGCASYPVRPPQPPRDADARRHAEVDACWRGILPAWLDDDALAAASALDGREAQASSANDSFHGATYATQPLGAITSGARVRALLEDRRRFEEACLTWRSAAGPPP